MAEKRKSGVMLPVNRLYDLFENRGFYRNGKEFRDLTRHGWNMIYFIEAKKDKKTKE
jgi:hypothetical protein